MKRTFQSFPVKDIDGTKKQMLNWASRFNICCFMDNHHYQSAHHSYECLLAVGCKSTLNPTDSGKVSLNSFYEATEDWIFGHFNYEYGAEGGENYPASNIHSTFPVSFLFVPEIIIILRGNELEIGVTEDEHFSIYVQLISTGIPFSITLPEIHFNSVFSRAEYLETVEQLIRHINRGDCYEINFCQEFYADQVVLDPYNLYSSLTAISPNPFSAFYRIYDDYLVCASPERFLQKKGSSVISQPIKGTSPRNFTNGLDDEVNRNALLASEKDRIENVMVVDLVRNDLSKICEPGSVKVDELFGIYTFPQLYQMISTISGILKPGMFINDILTATFPMGSMTGAPKMKVMELIRIYEKSRRGIYSGSLGYITPQKDFDFNVVIRSILYNSKNQILSYQVGGGITTNSIPEMEYEECMAKVAAIKRVFSNND